MKMHNERLARRAALKAALAFAAAGSLPGCGLFTRRPSPVCPNSPEVSRIGTPLTIDAHCHVFNGSDLQVNGFVTQILARQSGAIGIGARAIGPLLQGLGWTLAPSGQAERQKLVELGRDLQSCAPEEHGRRLQNLRDEAYKAGRSTLQMALANSPELQQFKQQMQIQGMDLNMDAVSLARLQLIGDIERLAPTASEYKQSRAGSDIRLMAHQRSAQGMLDFVLQNFQYRYVSVHDYLSMYDNPKSRMIDLMLPSMVDYDFWIAKGRATPTSLASQVDVMEAISVATGGRVHAFVPFDPLKQVALELDKGNADPFKLVAEAIETRGCVGVKLYPPMGFAAYGNTSLPSGFWNRKWLPSWVNDPETGKRLDDAMLKMLRWCETNEVPVMAHTGISNGPSDDFQQLAGAQYWSKALDKVPGLRVSFGHFGDSSLGSEDSTGSAHALGFMALMGDGPQAKGRHAFADAGYFVEGISQQPRLLAALRDLYEVTTAGQASLSMTLPLFRVVLSPTITRPFYAVPRTSVARTASG